MIGGILSGGAAMVTLFRVMKYWSDCGSGIYAGAVVISVWPVLTLLNAVVFALVFALARTRVGWGAAVAVAALALAVLAVVAVDITLPFVTPETFPPWDFDGYATSEEEIDRCVEQVLGGRIVGAAGL